MRTGGPSPVTRGGRGGAAGRGDSARALLAERPLPVTLRPAQTELEARDRSFLGAMLVR